MNTTTTTDVCLILEGTYPYIRGGVSSWVHQVLTEVPELTFSIFFIGSSKKQAMEYRYKIPENVKHIEEVFIYETFASEQQTPAKPDVKKRRELYSIQEAFYLEPDPAQRVMLFELWLEKLDSLHGNCTYGNLVRDESAWNMFRNVVEKYFRDEPFTDVYYTYLFLHAPLWKLIMNRHHIPKAHVYHSLCTGFAGMVGSIAAHYSQAPLIISEHGIYVKERIEEINQAKWIHDPVAEHVNLSRDQSVLKLAWIEMFKFQAYLAYEKATTVTTLFSRNLQLQLDLNCPREKIVIIPNGISPQKYATALRHRQQRLEKENAMTVGFIGRVVSIKDVKTLIRAIAFAKEKYPSILLKIIGPTDEEPDYYEECLALMDMLELNAHIDFTGRQEVEKVLADIDVMVLTSVSEGLPFVILEGYAAEIPCVATDVGACRELIFGNSPEDFKLGAGGRLTKVASPEQTANALIELLANRDLLIKTGKAGYQRLQKFYREDVVMQKYRELYYTTINKPLPSPTPLPEKDPFWTPTMKIPQRKNTSTSTT